MIDERRVCDLNAAELLEAAIVQLGGLGFTRGRWNIELFVDEGCVRQLRGEPPGVRGATVGRRMLERGRDELGSAA